MTLISEAFQLALLHNCDMVSTLVCSHLSASNMLQNALQVSFIAQLMMGQPVRMTTLLARTYRKIIFAAWPASSPQEREAVFPHDEMELTAHQLAYVDVKVGDFVS